MVRVFFATASLVAVYLDPTSPSRYVTLTYGLLVGYALYSVLLLAALRAAPMPDGRLVLAIHAGDMVAAAILTLFTDGPSSPFFILFGFALLAAGYRWGLWETLCTGIVNDLLLGLEAVLTSGMLGPALIEGGEFEFNRFALRCTYLLLLAVMVGYIAEHEKLGRDEANARGSTAERARMARELHDGVIQGLIGLKMRTELIRAHQTDPAATGAALVDIEGALRREIGNLRAMMFEVTPVESGPAELPLILADLVEQFEHASGISARFVSSGDAARTSARVRREIAQIVREALVNIRRHSTARNVLVSLTTGHSHWKVIVDDDGCGFDFAGRLPLDVLDRERRGPRVVKERIRLLGGSLIVDSRPGAGARLEIAVPLEG